MPAGVLPPPASNPGQATTGYQDLPAFAKAVSAATGIDPRVVIAWAQAEGAYAPNGTGHWNYLNLRPAGGDVGVAGVSSGNFDQFKDLASAEASTINRIKQPFLWQDSSAPPGLGAVIAAHGSPAQEIAAIGRSGWDTGHYGSPPGSKLLGDFTQLYGTKAAGAPPVGPGQAIAPGGTTGGSITSSIPGVGTIEGIGAGISRFVNFVTSVRLLELIGGLALVIVGLVILGKAMTSSKGVVTLATGVKGAASLAGVGGGGGESAGPISQQPRRVQRRAGFEGPSSRSYQRAQRARARARGASSGPGEEIPF